MILAAAVAAPLAVPLQTRPQPGEVDPEIVQLECVNGCRSRSSSPSAQATLDDFEILDGGRGRSLGKGSFGVVRRVEHRGTGVVYALKTMQKIVVIESDLIDQVEREIQVQQGLKHANLVRLYKHFQDSETVYLLLEFCAKGELYQLLRTRRNRRFEEDTARHYFTQVTRGLQYLHRQSIVHRDVKPENLLVTHDDVLKIADFGWCAVSTVQRMTFCGTLDYLAPEMIQARGHNHTLDIWSLGVLLYEMVVGRPPFQSTQHVTLMARILAIDLRFPALVTPPVSDLVQRLLQMEPKLRMPLEQVLRTAWVLGEPEGSRVVAEVGITPGQPSNVANITQVVRIEPVQNAIQWQKLAAPQPKDGSGLQPSPRRASAGTPAATPMEPMVVTPKPPQWAGAPAVQASPSLVSALQPRDALGPSVLASPMMGFRQNVSPPATPGQQRFRMLASAQPLQLPPPPSFDCSNGGSMPSAVPLASRAARYSAAAPAAAAATCLGDATTAVNAIAAVPPAAATASMHTGGGSGAAAGAVGVAAAVARHRRETAPTPSNASDLEVPPSKPSGNSASFVAAPGGAVSSSVTAPGSPVFVGFRGPAPGSPMVQPRIGAATAVAPQQMFSYNRVVHMGNGYPAVGSPSPCAANRSLSPVGSGLATATSIASAMGSGKGVNTVYHQSPVHTQRPSMPTAVVANVTRMIPSGPTVVVGAGMRR